MNAPATGGATAIGLGMPAGPPPVLAPRRKTRQIHVGSVGVGSDYPVSVQSMTTTKTHDINATLQQIAELTASGCDIVRVACPRPEDAEALPAIASVSRFTLESRTANSESGWRIALDAGEILFDGEDIGGIVPQSFARLPRRSQIQMVFQDPTDSLNPRFTAARAIADPIFRLGDLKGRDAIRARCEELARQVGLPVELLDRFPHQLSGGQKARVGIARAIALKPDLVILDEPTAALDVSVQAVVLNLLQELKDTLGMSYLFVSHDLNVVRLLCDRVIVMRAGLIAGEIRRTATTPLDQEQIMALATGMEQVDA